MTTRLLWLGILQGLTEFLPVSSSGHLSIVQNLWGFESPPRGLDLPAGSSRTYSHCGGSGSPVTAWPWACR